LTLKQEGSDRLPTDAAGFLLYEGEALRVALLML